MSEQKPVAKVEGWEESRYMVWLQGVAAFDHPVGTLLYTHDDAALSQAQARVAVLERALRLAQQQLVDAAGYIGNEFDKGWRRNRPEFLEAIEAVHAALAAPPAQPIETLPLDYLRGFRDGLEWAADLAEAEDPRTSDWMYDDRNDLAEAIRRGPEMPPAQPAQAQPARLSDERIDEIASAMFYADEPMDSMARAFRPQWLESIARPLAHAIAAAVVPPGFVVVPEEPTEAMKEAVGFSVNMNYMDYLNSAIALHAYRAMIAAAKATK